MSGLIFSPIGRCFSLTRKKLFYSIAGLLFLLFILWGLLGSLSVQVTEYTVSSSSLPAAFDGFRIAHISDLHNEEFGADNEQLLSLLRSATPDMIVITGDLIDSYDTDVEVSAKFMEEAVKIAPCYYVCGNHELRMPNEYAALKKQMKACGVTVLEDRSIRIGKDGDHIQITGLVDYAKLSDNYISYISEPDHYTVLLTHRPEHFDTYCQAGSDLVFAGHAHGGQIRLPLVGALFAPGQGILPRYADGMHTAGFTTMLVSRGLGNSSLPFRFYCSPELVIAELRCE